MAKIKKQRQEMWWVILAKSKTLRFFAVSCEFILFLGGLWITFTVNDPQAKTWLSGNINMIFLTVMGWAIDAAMPEAWLHVVIQHVQKEKGQLGWSKLVAVCISVLFIGNIVYSIVSGGDTSKATNLSDGTTWVLLLLTILRITVGFVYLTVRQCQEWIKRQSEPTIAEQGDASFDPWVFIGWGAKIEQAIEQLQADMAKQITELASNHQTALAGLVDEDRLAKALDVQIHKWNLQDLQLQRVLSEIRELQEVSGCVAPEIDYAQLAKAILPHLRANIEPAVRAIWEESQSQVQMAPEPQQLEARARSQSHKTGGSRATQKPAPEPAKANANGSPEARLEKAYLLFLANQVTVSGRLLAKEAHVNRGFASKWLSQREKGGSESTTDPALEAIVTPMSEPVYE